MNRTNDQPQKEKHEFDWVTQRSSRTLPTVFKELRLQIAQDVKTRDALRPNYAPYEFSLADTDGGFRVLLKAKDLQMAVRFSLADRAILVSNDKGRGFRCLR